MRVTSMKQERLWFSRDYIKTSEHKFGINTLNSYFSNFFSANCKTALC